MPAMLLILASLALGGGSSSPSVAKPAGPAKSLVVLVSVSVSPTSITEGQSATASATANVSSCGLEIDWGDESLRTPTAAGKAQPHTFAKPGTYTVTASATGNCGGAGTATLVVRSIQQADLTASSAFAGDECQRRDCHPTLTDVSPTQFGPGTQLTLKGSDFGNVKGKVLFSDGGSPLPLDIVSWTGTRIVASGDQLSGLQNGPASVSVKATNGRQSIAAAVQFVAARWAPNLRMSQTEVKICAQGTSANQCNNVHVGESRKGIGIQIDLNARTAIRAHHTDFCDGPFCLGWPEGVDEYYVKSGAFQVTNVNKRISCSLLSGDGNSTCSADVQQFPASGPYKMLIRVHWKNSPKTQGMYELTIKADAPRGLY